MRPPESDDNSPVPEQEPPPDPVNERTDDWTEEAAAAVSDHTSTVAPLDNEHAQSLRSKLVLALALMLAVVTLVDEVVRQRIIFPEFANLERLAAFEDTNRVISALNTEIDFLAETAARDIDAHRDIDANQQGEPKAVSTPTSLPNQRRIQWSATIDGTGSWHWHSRPDEKASFPAITRQVRQADRPKNVLRGMTKSADGRPHLFAAIPIHGADDTNAGVDGYYVVGHAFDEQVVSELQKRTSVRFTLKGIGEKTPSSRGPQIETPSDSVLVVTAPLSSPSGEQLAELLIQVPRDVTVRSSRTNAFARYLSLCGTCASLLILLLLLQRIVIGRVEAIREHTEHIARAGILDADTKPPLNVDGSDEIGQLAKAFERMEVRLGDAQRKLSDTSHAAGMSLVADTVIHNVGNVLTNVNSLIETATERVDGLRIEPLEKLADRLRTDEADEAFRRATPDYLQRLRQSLEGDKDDLSELLHTLNENIQHIHQVIRDQRRHTKQGVEWTDISIRHLIDESVKCCRARLNQDNIRVEIESDINARIRSDRSLLLQVLINIIGNARNAMRDVKQRQPTLTIDAIRTVGSLHIRFRDNGCGIDAETLERIFDAHFTTRESGSGLGLHFCAIALKRIGASIRAESDGPGTGATFIVELPLETEADEPTPTAPLQSTGESND